MSECIFCKIINKEISAKVIDETDDILVIEDIAPKAPVHYLIIPKIHIKNIKDLRDTEEHNQLILNMFKMVRKLSENLKDSKDFNLISNNGPNASQIVFHMHWHFLSGKNMFC